MKKDEQRAQAEIQKFHTSLEMPLQSYVIDGSLDLFRTRRRDACSLRLCSPCSHVKVHARLHSVRLKIEQEISTTTAVFTCSYVSIMTPRVPVGQ